MDPALKNEIAPIVYTAGALAELKQAGLISGGIRNPTPRGVAAFDQLCADGYRPSFEQIRHALSVLISGQEPDKLFQLALLVNKWEQSIELFGPAANEPDRCDCSVCENRRGPDWRWWVQFAGIGVVVMTITVLAVLAIVGGAQ